MNNLDTNNPKKEVIFTVQPMYAKIYRYGEPLKKKKSWKALQKKKTDPFNVPVCLDIKRLWRSQNTKSKLWISLPNLASHHTVTEK